MTDRVDLDALDTDDENETEGPRRGDWFWHSAGDPADEPTSEESTGDSADGGSVADGVDAAGVRADAGSESESSEGASDPDAAFDDGSATRRTRVPHVPRENENKPVGIPIEGGGAGGTSARAANAAGDRTGVGSEAGDTGDAEAAPAGTTADATTANGPHGSAPSAMTMAFTYGAMRRLDSPILALANAAEWTDWIGVVGDVDAYVINKFVREEGLDIDFFNGAGTGPAERLREISTNANSMFAAERKVLVGTDADREIAAHTDWEFVPLTEAAEAAGWELAETDE